jgi:hypothetical protein
MPRVRPKLLLVYPARQTQTQTQTRTQTQIRTRTQTPGSRPSLQFVRLFKVLYDLRALKHLHPGVRIDLDPDADPT